MRRTRIAKSPRQQHAWPVLGVALLWGASTLGCGGDASTQLIGTWIGRPAPSGSGDDGATDWEQYDATVRMEFARPNVVRLQLVGREQPMRGEWTVIESTPGALLLEITTPAPPGGTHIIAASSLAAPSSDSTVADTPPVAPAQFVRRRFELEPDLSGNELTGFRLREVGADRQLGSLYFERAAR